MTLTSFARASVLIAAAALAGACDTTTRAPQNSNALVPGNPAATPAGTTGTATEPATAASGPAAPAEGTAATASTSEAATTAPRFREVTIPAGTVMAARLNTSIGSDTSRPEQRVDATLTRGVRINGVEALGSGATLRGIVTNAERSARVKGRASVAYRFNQLTDEGQTYTISTRTITHEAPGTKKRDAATIGVPAAGGAIIGGILGGKSGAVKGGVIGGAAGGAAVLSTRGKEVRLAPGATITVRLASPLTIRVPVR